MKLEMRRIYVLMFLCIIGINQIEAQSEVIMTINEDDITKLEFENIFKKNNRDTAITQESLDEYVDLFINFKLKVKEAEELGYDTIPELISELAGYRRQLARPYLVDSKLSDDLLQEAYDRMKEEVRASHILIKAEEEDTLDAYNYITELRDRVLGGEDFAELARMESEDPSAKSNSGDLGYFTSLQMVYPFETMAYNTAVGEVSHPVKTRFGYHLIKVEDRRKARGEIRVAHILVKSALNDPQNKQEATKIKVQEIHSKLKAGEDFGQLASQYSDDKTSAKKGGELPWFGTGKMIEEFEEQAFRLTENDQVSEPFQTSYGWHIIKRIDYRDIRSFDELKGQLKAKVSKDVRSELTRKSFLNKMKKEYGFQSFEENISAAEALVDTSMLRSKWRFQKSPKYDKPIYTIGDSTVTQNDYLEHLARSQRRTNETDLNTLIDAKRKYYEDQFITQYENDRLEKKYPEFRSLMKEYRDGVLLFELTDKKVWTKAVNDTTGLESFYDKNKNKFMYDDRVDATIYTCKDEKIAKSARKLVKQKVESAEINKMINEDSQLNITIISDMYEREDHEIFENVAFKKGISKPQKLNGQVVFVNIKEVLPRQPKPLNEARGLITASYQNHLEELWIEELRSKYTVNVNKDVLYSIK